MSATQRRIVSFAGSSIAVEYSGARLAAIVDMLFRHTLADHAISPHVTYRLTPGDALYRNDTLIYAGNLEAEWAGLLLNDACYHLTERSSRGPVFHAAGLAWHGRGILLPGGTGAGKTTLAAWLTTKGFDYLTDELVCAPHGSNVMQAFTRPLNLKPPSKTILQPYFDFDRHAAFILSGPHLDVVPPTLLGPANAPAEPPLSLIIFPAYKPGSDFELRPLSKAQAGLALMQCLVNARNLPAHGFSEITRLAKTIPAYTMNYAGFEHIGTRVEGLLSEKNDCDILATPSSPSNQV